MKRLASVPSHRDAPQMPDPGLDGIEACPGPDHHIEAPPGTIGVHLDMPLCWREAFLGEKDAALWHAKPQTKDELIEWLGSGIDAARRHRARYVTLRASHGNWEGILTGRHSCTDYDVLEALGDWVFLAMGERDLGIEVLFENTWHAGLRWNEPRLAEGLLKKVRYPRAGFAFDLGHFLLAGSGGASTENADMRRIKSWLKGVGPIGKKIRALYVHRPGTSPVASDLVKKVRESTDPAEKEKIARHFDEAVDAHRPWVSAPLKELLEVVQPEYLVHRLRGEGETWKELVRRQDALFQ